MPTATISNTIWDTTNPESPGRWLAVRSYNLARKGRVILPFAALFLIPFLSQINGSSAKGGAFPVLFFGAAAFLVMPLLVLSSNRGRAEVRRKLADRVLIVGTGDLARKLCGALDQEQSLVCHPGALRETAGAETPVVDLEGLGELVARDCISRVVVAEQDYPSRSRVASALVDLRLRGLKVTDAVDFYEQLFGKIWIEALNSDWFVYTSGFHVSKTSACLKRLLDVTGAILLLALTAPLIPIIALAILADSSGPILFRQVRVGQYGKKFVIFKFRSMRVDAESKSGAKWATQNDDRTTRVGRILRKFRLDEIPQALNVLRGEMSIVGPRPERPCFVEKLTDDIPFFDLRHYVKPGITGWAQVKYRYGSTVEDAYQKLQYDIYYAKHASVANDLGILFRTVGIVLFGKGR